MANTIVAPDPLETEPVDATAPRITPGWIVAGLLLIITCGLVHFYGVSVRDIATFTLYSGLAVALPGALLWRALLGRTDHISVDLAGGTALGYAIEIPIYLLCRAVGAPLAVFAWPLLTIVAFAAVPRLRRFWKGSGERLPIGVTITYAVLWCWALVYSAITIFRVSALRGPVAQTPYIDIPFHLALTGELKHHFPAQIPYVVDQPLNYHWFVYAHIASASWMTGIDPLVLIQRLIGLPVMAAFGVLTVAAGRALTGRYWPGLCAVIFATVALATVPYTWNAQLMEIGAVDSVWDSPTLGFALSIFAGLILVVIGILHDAYDRRRGPWVAVILMAGAVAGSKSTFLPILLCGALCALAVQLIRTRRPGPMVWLLVIIGAWLAFAQFVVFGGGTEGIVVAPLITVKKTVLGFTVLGANRPANPYLTLFVLCLITIAAWAFAWVGWIGLAAREVRRDPAVWLVLGAGIAGIAATFALGHISLSQIYFGRSARPYLALAAATGLAALIVPGRGEQRRARIQLWIASGALGVVAVYAIRLISNASTPVEPHVLRKAAAPYAILIVILAVLAVGLWIVATRRGLGRRAAAGAIALMAMATATPQVVSDFTSYGSTIASGHVRNVKMYWTAIPSGGQDAMYWLRDHSSPDDLVATNEHCQYLIANPCDARDFWISGLSERRVLVEGWAYTEQSLKSSSPYSSAGGGDYWDPTLLAANDAVFNAPTPANVAALAHGYGVRWLVAIGNNVSPHLPDFATLAYRSGGVSIYRIEA